MFFASFFLLLSVSLALSLLHSFGSFCSILFAVFCCLTIFDSLYIVYTWSHIRNILQFVWMMRCRRRLQDVLLWYVYAHFVAMFILVIRTANKQMQTKDTHCIMHILLFLPAKFEIYTVHFESLLANEESKYTFNILSCFWSLFCVAYHIRPCECQIEYNIFFFSYSNGCYPFFKPFYMQHTHVKIKWPANCIRGLRILISNESFEAINLQTIRRCSMHIQPNQHLKNMSTEPMKSR